MLKLRVFWFVAVVFVLSCGDAQERWYRANRIRLTSPDPQAPLEDLDALIEILPDAEVIGVGEATHGTREFFLLKHRLFRCLVEKRSFNALLLEADASAVAALNAYIQTGRGDAPSLIRRIPTWPLHTKEFLDLVEWMRDWNASGHTNRLTVAGFDMPLNRRSSNDLFARDELMAQQVLRYRAEHPAARLMVWAHNQHISRAPGNMGATIAKSIGPRYLPIALGFGKGAFNAVEMRPDATHPAGLRTFSVGGQEANTLDGWLLARPDPLFLLDVRDPPPQLGRISLREVGAVFTRDAYMNIPRRLPRDFDFLLFVRDTTAPVRLQKTRG